MMLAMDKIYDIKKRRRKTRLYKKLFEERNVTEESRKAVYA